MGIKYIEPLRVGELLATVANRKGPVGQRDTCIVRLLWESGLRINECLSLTPADINLETQEIIIRNGKGGKSRTVPWRNERTTDLLRVWLEVRPDSEFIFPVIRSPRKRKGENKGKSTKGEKLDPKSFRASFKRYVKQAGLPNWLSPHNMRHSYAIYMLDQGVPLPALQRLLGHSRLDTTGVYLEIRDKDAIEKAKMVKDDW
ncbi:tyrosine-type recombinase/integrase [Candidatus Parcubacteria bacterium]|nr:tyrosine-type recombinase/integrase [Candidatus Parcubacteria bacterium]